MTDIDRMLLAARTVQPDLWNRTAQIARIITPEAFMKDWVVDTAEHAALLETKLKFQQAVAMSKAQAILAFLGVNTEADWYAILEEMARKESVSAPKEQP